MARTGLRMMPTFPSSPLKFRTASFPQYGFKASMSDGVFRNGDELKSSPDMRSSPSRYAPAFVHVRATDAAWALSPTRLALRRTAVQTAIAALPQGSLAPERVLLSHSIVADYDPIRQSHEHATISRHGRLYVAPSLGGSASATHETFPTFTATLSTRAIDHTPVGPPPPSRCSCAVRYQASSVTKRVATHDLRLCQLSSTGRAFRRCIVRVKLRPACLPRPPDWLQNRWNHVSSTYPF